MSEQEETRIAKRVVPLKASDALATSNAYEADLHRWRALIASGQLPKHVTTPEAAITLARAGEIYGWDPIRSLRSLFLVEGRVEMWAADMLGLIREKCPEATIQPVAMSADAVTIRVTRPPTMPEPCDVTVTAAEFKHLIDNPKKPTWKHYRGDMLWARCVSRVGRRFFSDVIAGAYTEGEIAEAEFTVRQEPREKPTAKHVKPPSLDSDAPGEPLDGPGPTIDYEVCDLCGGTDGQHTDELCPNVGVAELYTEKPDEEGAA